MIKTIISIILIVIGIYTWLFWATGSHDHIRFRPYMIEDWILSIIEIICFGIPLFFIFQKIKRRKKNKLL